MTKIMLLREMRKPERLTQAMVRLPQEIRRKAKLIAAQESSPGRRVTETDVYRTAILNFLDQFSTDSRGDNKGGDDQAES